MKRLLLAIPLLILGGCVVRARPAVVEVRGPVVEAAPVEVVAEPVAPVIEGGEVVVGYPPVEQRVYVEEVGFPPGVYLYGGFYYYGGHRYHQDIFRTRFVHENIIHHRYEHVDHRAVVRARELHRENGGRPHGGSHGRPGEVHRH